MKRRILVMALSVVLALVVVSPMAVGKIVSPMAVGEVEQNSREYGRAGKLAAAWWQWALSKPEAKNPIIGEYTGGPQCNGRPVTETPGTKQWWFLAGTFGGGGPVERTCTMPAERWLFFPLVNGVFLITEPGETEEDARRAVNEFMDNVLTDDDLSMSVSVAGKEVLRRADSPLFNATVPEDNVAGVPAGSYPAVADGLWVTVPPLSKGEHTIHFELRAPEAGITQDVTYHLTVR